MKFYFLNGTFKENKPTGLAFKEALEAHHAYWGPYMKAGKVLLSGPKMHGAGLIVLKCTDDENVQDYINNDPFVTRGVADFEPLEFKPFFKIPAAEDWFKE